VSRTPHDPEDAIAQYEALRGDATRSMTGLGPSHGLALFLARGMAAWLEALSALGPRQRPAVLPEAPPRSEPVAFAPTVRAELTTVLAAMVLACTAGAEEVEDDVRGEGDGRPFAAGRVSLRPPVVAPASA
jgi:hypothetical protein